MTGPSSSCEFQPKSPQFNSVATRAGWLNPSIRCAGPAGFPPLCHLITLVPFLPGLGQGPAADGQSANHPFEQLCTEQSRPESAGGRRRIRLGFYVLPCSLWVQSCVPFSASQALSQTCHKAHWCCWGSHQASIAHHLVGAGCSRGVAGRGSGRS